LIPTRCSACGEGLSGLDAEAYRHQVAEVPELRATVTEYQVHTLCCGRCGESTTAGLPDGVPSGAFGPRLQAIVAVCSGAYRLSKRSIVELAHDFFGVTMSLGSVSNLEQATSEALVAPVAEAAAYVRAQPVVHA